MASAAHNLAVPVETDTESPAGAAGPAPATVAALGEQRRIRVNGVELNVLVAGEGPDVLLIHGFPDSWEVWRRQVPVLVAAGYRVIAPDMRGCGDSEIRPDVADYRMEHLLADLVALLDHLGIAKVKLVAHDWGAVIGWQFAMAHPERVERYVALSVGHPHAYAHADPMQKIHGWYVLAIQARGLAEWMVSRRYWAGLRRMVRYDDEFPRWRERLSRPGRLTAGFNYYRANVGLLLSHRLDRPVTVPVDAFWSSGDRFLTEKQMKASEGYVHAPWTYTRIDGANHWLQLDAADRFNPMLLDRLAGREKEPR